MYNEIIAGIMKQLKDLFPEAGIGTIPLEEGITKPYFEVGLLETYEKPVNGQRYFRSVSMYVNYYGPDSQHSITDRNQVLDVLMDKLEYVTLDNGSLIRGTNRRGKNEGNVLSFQVEYQVHILKPGEPKNSMEDIKLK